MFYALQETCDRNLSYLPEWLNTNSFLPVTQRSLIYISVTGDTLLLFFFCFRLYHFFLLLLSGHEDADGGCRPQQRWSLRRNCFLSFPFVNAGGGLHLFTVTAWFCNCMGGRRTISDKWRLASCPTPHCAWPQTLGQLWGMCRMSMLPDTLCLKTLLVPCKTHFV